MAALLGSLANMAPWVTNHKLHWALSLRKHFHTHHVTWSFFLINLFLVALGLRCSVWAFSICGVRAQSLQSCPTLCFCMDCSLPGSSVHGILQARILGWVAMPSYRGSSWPRDRTQVSSASCITGRLFTVEPVVYMLLRVVASLVVEKGQRFSSFTLKVPGCTGFSSCGAQT